MSFESDNAKQLAKLIIDQGLPHIEDTIPAVAISSQSLGITQSSLSDLCWEIVAKATSTKSESYRQGYFQSTQTIIYSLIFCWIFIQPSCTGNTC